VIRSKTKRLAIGCSVAVLAGVLGKLAIDQHLLGKPTEASRTLAEDAASRTLNTEAVAMHQQSKITLQTALQIAETAIKGKAYGIEREIENGKPVIEVDIKGQEVFVDVENGEIVAIENLYQEGDRKDLEDVAEALKLQEAAPIPIQAALQSAERFTEGQIHTVELENEEGNLVYEVMIDRQKIYVDAGNGKVLYTGTVGQSNAGDHPKSSIQIP
jgi:uncharacterized membrane protein YkoI